MEKKAIATSGNANMREILLASGPVNACICSNENKETKRVVFSTSTQLEPLAREISKKLHIQLHVTSAIGDGTSVSMSFTRTNSFEQIRRSML